MTAPAELSAGVLFRVAEFLKKLPADQLAELASGAARLEVVPEGAIIVPPGAGIGTPRTRKATARVAKPAPVVDIERARADLRAFGDRAAATRYLDDLKLGKSALKDLAKELGVTVRSKDNMADIRDAIVQRFVGSRLAAEAVSRPAPPRG